MPFTEWYLRHYMCCRKSVPTRRTFLAAGGAAAAAVTLAACNSVPEQDTFSGGKLTRAIRVEDLPPGDAIQLTVGANQILLYRDSEQSVHAYSAVCTHQGCIVGVPDQEPSAPFVCPCHASNFDKTTGEAVAGPAQLPLTRHSTSIEDGWLLVEVEPA